jgi:niacin transporter
MMSRPFDARFISLTGLLLATGVIFPFVFHQFGIAGRIFLPMHLPVFLAGLVLGPWAGLLVGALSPGLSAVTTGMPPAALAIPMTPELAVYGLVSGLLFRGTRTSLYVSLLGAMIIGRIVWIPMAMFIAPLLGFEGRALTVVLAALAVGWPGIVMQLLFVPPLVLKLRQAVPGREKRGR